MLDGIAVRTPMEESRWLSALAGGPVSLKCENLQRTGSFKIRGAYVRISRLSAEERAHGVVAACAGNHAQGVALAATTLGIASTVFMPEGAPIPKEKATRGLRRGRASSTAATSRTRSPRPGAFAEETGAVLIHPFDHADIVAGQGTLGLEILEQAARRTHRAGAHRWRGTAGRRRHRDQGAAPGRTRGRACRPRVPRPSRVAAPPASPVALESMTTMADGIAVGRPGDITFAAVRDHVDDIITVSEESLSRALLALVERAKHGRRARRRGGRRGAARQPRRPSRRPAVAVLSGGNIDPLLLSKVIRHGLAAAGRYLYLRVVHPRPARRPGRACSPRSAPPGRTCSRSPTSGSRRPCTLNEVEVRHPARDPGRGARRDRDDAGCASAATASTTRPDAPKR